MSRDWIVVGDSTTHGGTVLAGDAVFLADGKPVARVSDPVACPKCKGVFPIVSGAGNLIGSNGQRVARHGDATSCGATLIAGGQRHGVWVSDGANINVSGHAVPEASFDDHYRFLDRTTGHDLEGVNYVLVGEQSAVDGQTDEGGAQPAAQLVQS